jgi:predicted nucleic acid-binding protein
MALVVDAGALVAQAIEDDPYHSRAAGALRAETDILVTTDLAVAEADYLILDRLGVDAELAFIDDLVAGTYIVDCLTRDELADARGLVANYRELRIGLAHASLVVLADRYATTRILTFDQRAFRAVTPLKGGAFTIVPADDA